MLHSGHFILVGNVEHCNFWQSHNTGHVAKWQFLTSIKKSQSLLGIGVMTWKSKKHKKLYSSTLDNILYYVVSKEFYSKNY